VNTAEMHSGEINQSIFKSVYSGIGPDRQLQRFFLARAKRLYEIYSGYGPSLDENFVRYALVMNALQNETTEDAFLVENIIAHGVKCNSFDVENIRMISKGLITAMMGYDFFIFQGRSLNEIEGEIKEYLRVFINGISRASE